MRRLIPWLLVLLAGCGGGSGHSHTLQYYFTYDPRSLDPAISTDVPTGEVIATLFDNLTQFNVDGELTPGLARTWEVDSNGLRYTFHLRTGARFHDGRPVRAEDVRRTYLRALDPKATGGRPWPLYPIAGAQEYADGKAPDVRGLAAPDDSTVVITLRAPLNVFPKLLAMPVTAIVPIARPRRVRPAPGRQRAVEIRVLVA